MRLLYLDDKGDAVLAEGDEVTVDLLDEIERDFWLDIPLNHPVGIDLLENYFRFHRLTVEDAVEPGTRPKIDFFDHYLFIVSYSIERPIDEETEFEYVYRDVSFYAGRDYLVTVRDPKARFVDRYLKDSPASARLLSEGPDYILYNILDDLVDDYFPILFDIENRIDEIEDKLFDKVLKNISEEIFKERQRLAGLKRRVLPMRSVLRRLIDVRPDFFGEEIIYAFQDIYDHTIRLADIWENEKLAAAEAMETYLSMMNQRMDRIMKTLTIIATIMMPLTLITGIYGMNFVNMPELSFKYGYFVVIGAMLLVTLGFIVAFRKWGWFK
ncbi:MAG: magnesium/cobalt transporter CorA [bacterium]|nr:magnesium/cobalt transporter CorA [bacterium]